MWLSTLSLLGLVSVITAKYGLYFTGDSSLKYDYPVAVDMANNNIHIEFTIPLFFSQSLDQSGLPIALLNISSTNQDSLTVEIHPGNYIFITVLAPASAMDDNAVGYCMYSSPIDSDKILILDINRTGEVIEMTINGEGGDVQCIPISVEPDTGEINLVKFVTIGYTTDTAQLTSFVGCIHAAVIDGIDLLADICKSPTQGKSTSKTLTFESDSCPAAAPPESVQCPITTTPTQSPEPTTNKTVSSPTTLRPVDDNKTLPTLQPTDTVEIKPTTDGIPTGVPDPTEAAPVDPGMDNIVDVEATDYEINETEDKGDNATVDVILEESSSDDASNSLIIIIVVVVVGVIVVVILLTVGYKFHFRDKGSYKLEESKNFDNDGFNEYTDLNPNEKKNEEWYL